MHRQNLGQADFTEEVMSTAILDRVRALLDIYSPNPVSRTIVVAMMTLGVVTLARGIASGSGVGAIPILLLVWANHERFLATVESLLARNDWLLLGLPLAVFVARLLMVPPAASDDLLRHIASAFWPGRYADMYAYSALPPASLYPGFDAVVGALAVRVGPAFAMWITQGLAFGGFVLVFVLAGYRQLAGQRMAAPLVLAALVVTLTVMGERLFLGRPEIFMTIWALAALLVRGKPGAVVWMTAGLLLCSGYWLAALYFPAVILLPLTRRGRAAAFVLLCAAWLAMWWWLADGHPARAIAWTLEQANNRIAGFEVGENRSIVNLMLHPVSLVLLIGAAWSFGRDRADARLLVLAGFFALSNQSRYGGVVLPLLALHILSALRGLHATWPARTRCAVVAVAVSALSLLSSTIPAYAALPRFELPAGSTVLTGFSVATYSTLFANPGRVRVTPAFEIGALDPAMQLIVKELAEGRVECERLQRYRFTHLVEDSLSGPAPRCLTLLASQRGWRLWRVQP